MGMFYLYAYLRTSTFPLGLFFVFFIVEIDMENRPVVDIKPTRYAMNLQVVYGSPHERLDRFGWCKLQPQKLARSIIDKHQ
jgi:hypothetical protein